MCYTSGSDGHIKCTSRDDSIKRVAQTFSSKPLLAIRAYTDYRHYGIISYINVVIFRFSLRFRHSYLSYLYVHTYVSKNQNTKHFSHHQKSRLYDSEYVMSICFLIPFK